MDKLIPASTMKDAEVLDADYPAEPIETEGAMLVHPVVVARVGGEPANLFGEYASCRTAKAIRAIDDRIDQLKHEATEVCAALEEQVPDIDDRKLSHRVIQLKRDLFNQRAVKLREDVARALPADLTNSVPYLLTKIRKAASQRDELVKTYADDVNQRREQVRQLFERDNLRLGILASNPLLYEKLKKLTGSSNPIPSGKKAAYPFDSLVSFASRSSLKSSPLSTFTIIWTGDWEGNGDDIEASSPANCLPYDRQVEVKHAALLHALEPIWSDIETLGDDFSLSMNPTLRRVGNELKWDQIY
ncbi:MAG: hypothetical protein AAFO63_12830, partial [Pseudomonadota bacterium]